LVQGDEGPAQVAFPDLGIEPEAFGAVGMAAFFTGVVQARVTGMVLVIEMTAGFTMLLPMLGACFAAILMPNLLHSAPIYKSLREQAARRQRSDQLPEAGRVRSRDHR
jgi:CIC family chloride channel protein